jgi:diguanylate cyclase (GGDEF)-like protein
MVATHRSDVQRVLYVDDDPVSRRIFEQLGKSARVAVDVCGSLDEAFAFARQQPYSVIAADYSLRRWDGLSVLRELSGLQAHASLMLVTDAERKSELPSSLLKYVFVEKPIRRAEVLNQLSEAVAAYTDRTSTPHAALLSAPVLLLAGDPFAADYLAGCLLGQGQNRLRVTRAFTLDQGLLMLKSVSFAAALVDASLRDASTGETVDALLAQAPGLPIVLTSDAEDERERQLAGARAARVSVLKRRAPGELIVHVLCSAVERAERQRQIAALTQNDLTTGARNRPTFCALLARRVDQREPFVLCCFGIDGLADINESLGHIRGDAVLAASVARLARELGPAVTLGRLGGGVFAVLAEAPTPDTGPAILRTIRQVFDLPFDLSDTHVRVEVNVASVEFPEHGVRAEDLLRKVERALRDEKAVGERRRSSRPPPARSHS